MTKIWNKLKTSRLFWSIVVVIAAFLLGLFLGICKQPVPPAKVEIRTVEDTATKQKLTEALRLQQHLQAKLSAAEKTISDLKVHKTEHVHAVYHSDGTKVVDKTTTTDTNQTVENTKNIEQKHEETTQVASKVQASNTSNVHVDNRTSISSHDSRFYAGISSRVGITGFSNPGLEFKYRLLDVGNLSFWTGAEVMSNMPIDPMDVQFRLSLGVTF